MNLAKTLATACVAAAATAALAAAPAGALPPGTGGAGNMVNANAVDQMTGTAMTHDDANGNAGMFCAVFITNEITPPGSCR